MPTVPLNAHPNAPLALRAAAEESPASGVSWGAALAGAIAAAALSFLLLLLGVGLGLSAASPWSNQGASAGALGVSTILWVTFTQLAASGIGGYLAGRLRTRWARLHTDEVYFRDTAHGLIAWSVATLTMAGLMGTAVGNVLSSVASGASSLGGAAVGSTVAAAAQGPEADSQDKGLGSVTGYWVDSLLRQDTASAAAAATATPSPAAAAALSTASAADDAALHAEVGRILARALRNGALPPEDARYLGLVVSRRTGVPVAEGERRVTTLFGKARQSMVDASNSAKQKADQARKASAYSALWMFVALLAGAFVAALMATFGGRQRDAAVIDL